MKKFLVLVFLAAVALFSCKREIAESSAPKSPVYISQSEIRKDIRVFYVKNNEAKCFAVVVSDPNSGSNGVSSVAITNYECPK